MSYCDACSGDDRYPHAWGCKETGSSRWSSTKDAKELSAPQCDNGCQYAKDVGMDNDSCSGRCMYLSNPDNQDDMKPQASDPVNQPSHYASGGVECIEAIKASMSPEAFRGYLKGNVQKYIWRYEKKVNPKEDLKKAQVYLGWLIAETK